MTLAIAIGLVIGLVLGLTGAGGSLLAVPLLLYGLGLPPAEAVGVSLGAVALAAITGIVSRLPRREIVWLPSLVFAATGMVAAPVGLLLGRQLPEDALLAAFVALMTAIGARMAWQARHDPDAARLVRAGEATDDSAPALCRFSRHGQFELRLPCMAGLAAGGLVTGFLSGLFGVGGGFIIVPALMLLTSITLFQAVGSSLLVISLVSSTGFASFLLSQQALRADVLAATGGGAVLGMLAGTRLARRLAGPVLQRFFVLLILSTAAYMAWQLATRS